MCVCVRVGIKFDSMHLNPSFSQSNDHLAFLEMTSGTS